MARIISVAARISPQRWGLRSCSSQNTSASSAIPTRDRALPCRVMTVVSNGHRPSSTRLVDRGGGAVAAASASCPPVGAANAWCIPRCAACNYG
jgi:hypothetical protein